MDGFMLLFLNTDESRKIEEELDMILPYDIDPLIIVVSPDMTEYKVLGTLLATGEGGISYVEQNTDALGHFSIAEWYYAAQNGYSILFVQPTDDTDWDNLHDFDTQFIGIVEQVLSDRT